MSGSPFRIETNVARGVMTITFDAVFWDSSVAEQFKAACLDAVAALHCAPGKHMILVDLRNAVLQSQAVYERMQLLIGAATAAKIALVASRPLARMQTKRLQLRDNIIMFGELSEAELWLSSREAA